VSQQIYWIRCSFTNRNFRFCEMSVAPKAYACTFPGCTTSWHTLGKLGQRRRIHFEGKAFACNQGRRDARFEKREFLNDHLTEAHSDALPFICPECSRPFGKEGTLVTHMRVHKQDSEFVCQNENCGRSFTKAAFLMAHKCTAGKKIFPCTFAECGMSFETQSKLDRHLPTHTREKKICEECGQSFARLDTHICASLRVSYPCPLEDCDITCISPSKLNKHISSHTQERIFECDAEGCDRRFVRKDTLVAHVLQVHSKERPFVCEECGKGFPQVGALAWHRRIHADVKQYICPFEDCGAGFDFSNALYAHQSKHTGEGYFKCDHQGCGKAFTAANGLVYHKRRYHLGLGIPCRDSDCGKNFSTAHHMELHHFQKHIPIHEQPNVLAKAHWIGTKLCAGCRITQLHRTLAKSTGYCCECRTTLIGVFRKEFLVQQHLTELLGSDIVPRACDDILFGGPACGTDAKARPDLVYIGDWATIVVEVDEHSHESYETNCEVKRYDTLAFGVFPGLKTPEDHARPQIVLRVNPDAGLPGAPSFPVRMMNLAAEIRRFYDVRSWDELITELGMEPDYVITLCYVHYMYYGATGQKHIEAAKKAEEGGAPIVVVYVTN